jgi:hypothetical protein
VALLPRPVPALKPALGAVGPGSPEVTVAFTVIVAEEVTVRVMTLVESCSEAEVQVEFVQRTEDVPMGSAVSMVVPAVTVSVGREVDKV